MADDVNLTRGLFFLISWSALAGAWWLIAILLVVIGPRRRDSKTGSTLATLTIFKPLPPVRDENERAAIADAIESFAAQLDRGDEMLVGVDVLALPSWEGIFGRWRAQWPDARIKIAAQPTPALRANPKVAWMELLSAQAQGELWLWSDADVIVPPGFLCEIKEQFSASRTNAVTTAYAIHHLYRPAGVLDALFVNVEFLPGAMLLGRLGDMDFAFGAGTVFRASTFRERVNWADFGAHLADDYELGRRLKPVELSRTIVSTFTQPGSWRVALKHYYRWQKTIRWCRPGGFAALILVIPMIGWSVALVLDARSRLALAGFVGQWMAEILVGSVICSLVGCRLSPRSWGGLAMWPLIRMVSWVGTWLPLPVIWGWREEVWSTPKKDSGA